MLKYAIRHAVAKPLFEFFFYFVEIFLDFLSRKYIDEPLNDEFECDVVKHALGINWLHDFDFHPRNNLRLAPFLAETVHKDLVRFLVYVQLPLFLTLNRKHFPQNTYDDMSRLPVGYAY